jgi:hypothetical protein
VQTRDAATANPHHYRSERTDAPDVVLPPRGRRVAIILVYALWIVAANLVLYRLLWATGAVSAGCLVNNVCAPWERTAVAIVDYACLGLIALCIIQGWRGRLIGCRAQRRSQKATTRPA